MKKIPIKKMEEDLYYEKLDNGLEIYMLPKKNVNNVYVTFTAKYGSIINEFVPLGKKNFIKVPNGIAHFLEHKMFEQEDGVDPMIFYASKGADVNAITSFYHTSYLFYGPDNLKDNLLFLLNYVQNPYFTDENVDMEKGIIKQEIRMYDDDPYSVLYDELRINAFHNHPIKYSVSGTVDDIEKITKEDLYNCYHTFYHPSNMFLVLTGKFDPDNVIKIIKDDQERKNFDKYKKIITKKIDEPDTVVKEYGEKKLEVEISKLAFAIKIPIYNIKIDTRKRNYYLTLLFDILFGSTSLFYEKMKEKNYIDSPIMLNPLYTDKHILILLYCDTKKSEEMIKEIKKELTSFKIDKEDFERKKKKLIGMQIYLYEDIRHSNSYILNNIIIYGNFENNMLKLLRELNSNEFNEFVKSLNLNNTTSFVINPIKNEKVE